jgi:hypothetical protein
MRLIDRVVSSPPEVGLPDEYGRNHQLPGVGSKADRIRQCQLRFILDEAASRECMNLVVHPNDGLLDPENDLLRLPATQFWVEWLGMKNFDGHPKVGALVEASDDGLSGSITGYWEDELGRAVTIGSVVSFDLSRWNRGGNRRTSDSRLRHGVYHHLDDLLERARIEVDPAWSCYFRIRSSHSYRESVRALADQSWYCLPFITAFAAMLNSRDVLEQRPSQLERLNAARLRRGRQPLLDHIEVGLKLGRSGAIGDGGGASHLRNRPRLHHVRGHFVHRSGKTFWRSSHLRGDAGRPIPTKTVMVSAEVGAGERLVRVAP